MMASLVSIIVTPYGTASEQDLPPAVWRDLVNGKWRIDGMPDQRSHKTLAAWNEACEIMRRERE